MKRSQATAWPLDDRWSGFTELYGWREGSSDAGDRQALAGGLTFRVDPDVELGVWGGVGRSDRADAGFLATGLSVRNRRDRS